MVFAKFDEDKSGHWSDSQLADFLVGIGHVLDSDEAAENILKSESKRKYYSCGVSREGIDTLYSTERWVSAACDLLTIDRGKFSSILEVANAEEKKHAEERNASDDKKHAEAEESERRPLPSAVKAAQRTVKRVVLGTVVPAPGCEFFNVSADDEDYSGDDGIQKQSGAVTKGGQVLFSLSAQVQANVEQFAESHLLDQKVVSALEEAGDDVATKLVNQGLRDGIRNKSAYVQKACKNAVAESVQAEEDEKWPEATPETTPEQAYEVGYADGYAEGVEVWAEPEAEEEAEQEQEQEDLQADDEHENWDSLDDWY